MTLDFIANMPLSFHNISLINTNAVILFPTITIRTEKAKLHRFAYFAQRDQHGINAKHLS